MIGIVIPFYKDNIALEKCLLHIKNQNIEYKIYIKDNSEDNIYFTKAINKGIKEFLDLEYICCLNQDAYLYDNCLNDIIDFMKSESKCGIAAPISYDNDRNITWAGSKTAFPFGEHVHEILDKVPYKTYWSNGACMVFKTEMIKEIGILDENMEFICSDADYSFTARSRGWDVYCIPYASVTHELHNSITSNKEVEYRKYLDSLYFYKKWINGQLYDEMSYENKKLHK